MLPVDQVTIIGTGLLGTSVALGLRHAGYAGEIVGVGRRRETLDGAMARGGYSRCETELVKAVKPGGLVIVAVPLGGFAAVFDAIAAAGVPGVVTDVGSTKGDVLREARRRLRPGQRFVGSHPMAGNEHQGPDGAEAELCRGKPCVITPEADTDAEALRVVEALWRGLGMTLLHMPADEHDRRVAAISHVPHLMSVLLVGLAERYDAWGVASTGFRDTTRLASSNPPMRADIIASNREAIAAAGRALRDELDALLAAVEAGDRDKLLAVLEDARSRRADWIGDGPSGGDA